MSAEFAQESAATEGAFIPDAAETTGAPEVAADLCYMPLGATALGEIPATPATMGGDGSFTDSSENLKR